MKITHGDAVVLKEGMLWKLIFCMCAWEAILSCYVLGCSVLAINACLQNYSSTWWLTLNLNGNARLGLIILKVI